MRIIGSPAWAIGAYEIRKVIEQWEPIALTAAVYYATGKVQALEAAGGWRAVIAAVLVSAWTVGRQWASDNSKARAVVDDEKIATAFAAAWKAIDQLRDELKAIREMIEDRQQH